MNRVAHDGTVDGDALELTSGALGDPTVHGYRIAARGDIDLHTAGRLAEAIDAVIGVGAKLVVVDATDVSFVDSSGLRVLVHAGNRLGDAGGRLLIEGMSGAVQRVLEISGLIEQYRA